MRTGPYSQSFCLLCTFVHMVLTLHPSLSAGNTEGSPYYQPRSESCPRYSSTLRLRLNFAIDRRHLIGNISSRQTATEIYTELRAAFRDGSDYDPAENCSAETGGRFPRKFRSVNFCEVVQHGITRKYHGKCGVGLLALYVIPRNSAWLTRKSHGSFFM